MKKDENAIRLGVLGLGRAFTLMVPTFVADTRIKVVAGYDPRPHAVSMLAQQFGATPHDSAESLCSDPAVEWIYVATPHQLHLEHVILAARNRKHILVEKPMALSMYECQEMVTVCDSMGVHLVVGHSHSFDAPILLAQELICQGELGRVRMIHSMNFTDFLYRPRRPEELDTSKGGGVVHSQAAHQVDIVRLLGGGEVTSVYARTGQWDDTRPTEGAYVAILDFANGAFASLTYNGYGYYDSDAQMGWISEMGRHKLIESHSQTHRKRKMAMDEIAEANRKAERNFGGSAYVPESPDSSVAYQHFGPILVSCEKGDLQLNPMGVRVIDANGEKMHALSRPLYPRKEVIDEIWAVAMFDQKPVHDGRWALATVEVCLAILASESQRQAIIPVCQVRRG